MYIISYTNCIMNKIVNCFALRMLHRCNLLHYQLYTCQHLLVVQMKGKQMDVDNTFRLYDSYRSQRSLLKFNIICYSDLWRHTQPKCL